MVKGIGDPLQSDAGNDLGAWHRGAWRSASAQQRRLSGSASVVVAPLQVARSQHRFLATKPQSSACYRVVLVPFGLAGVIVSVAVMHEKVHQRACKEEQEWCVAEEAQGMPPMVSQQPEETGSCDGHGRHL
jgi:hypothetical protein